MSVKLWRVKSTVVEAYRFGGSSTEVHAFTEWMAGKPFVAPAVCTRDLQSLEIQTAEGVSIAHYGDWIIKGAKGEFYPCKPKIFAETYEDVGRAAHGSDDVWGRFASWLLDHCEGDSISEEMLQQQLAAMIATLMPEAHPQHPDEVAVDRFAAAMKAKLAESRAKGRGGWEEQGLQQRLSDLLREHVDKGDPRDVANFACFLFSRGEGIAPREGNESRQGGMWVSGTMPPHPSTADETGATTQLALYAPMPADGGPSIRQGYFDHARCLYVDSMTGRKIEPFMWSSPPA